MEGAHPRREERPPAPPPPCRPTPHRISRTGLGLAHVARGELALHVGPRAHVVHAGVRHDAVVVLDPARGRLPAVPVLELVGGAARGRGTVVHLKRDVKCVASCCFVIVVY